MIFKKNFRTIILSTVILLGVPGLAYYFFWKPNPAVRVNMNKNSNADNEIIIEMPEEVSIGKSFSAQILVNTKDKYINAIESIIEYDPGVLEVVNTSTEKSICHFYVNNDHNNSKGYVKLVCGIPYPGFRGTGEIETVDFVAKATKETEVKVSPDSKILANDGKGTNILGSSASEVILIKQSF